MPTRKYTYYDYTISLCPECLRRIDAKIVFEDGNVYILRLFSFWLNTTNLIVILGASIFLTIIAETIKESNTNK